MPANRRPQGHHSRPEGAKRGRHDDPQRERIPQAITRVEAERQRFAAHAAAWKRAGSTDEQIERLKQLLESFHMQHVEEVRSYERLKRGDFDEVENLSGLGRTLIDLRIARGMTQRELAERLGVDESSVSRDERNEYHRVTVERAGKILDALGVRLRTRVEVEPLPLRAA